MPRQVPIDAHIATALDLVPTPIVVFDIHSHAILYANDSACTRYGYSRTEFKALSLLDIKRVSDAAETREIASRLVGEIDRVGEVVHVTRTGEEFVADITSRLITVGDRTCKIATIHDTRQTASIRAESIEKTARALEREHAANERARHLKALFNAMPGRFLVVTSSDHIVEAASDGYLEALDGRRDDIVGQSIYAALGDPEGVREAGRLLRASLLRVAETGEGETMPSFAASAGAVNIPISLPDGTIAFIIHHLPVKPARGDRVDPQQIEVVAQDQLAKTLREQLDSAQAKLDTAQHILGFGTLCINLENDRLEWSDNVFFLYGISPESAAPTLDDYVQMVHPEDRPAMRANLESFLASDADHFTFDHRIVRPDGTVVEVIGGAKRVVTGGNTYLHGVVQDVTEARATARYAEQSAKLLTIAGEIARFGGWRVDLETGLTHWTPGTAIIHDMPHTRTLTLERNFDLYPPEYRDTIEPRFQACARDGTPFDDVHQIVTATGRRVWVRTIGQPVRNDHGEIIAVEGAFQDVSDLVHLRERSETLRDQLLRTFEGMGEAFIHLDHDWCVQYVNAEAERLLARRRDDVLNRNVWEVFPEAIGTTFEAQYRHAVATGVPVTFDEYFAPLDRWLRVNAHPGPYGLCLFFRDVTAESSRLAQLHLLETALNRTEDILIITDAEPVDHPGGPPIVYVNDAFVSRTGFTRDEAIGNTPAMLQGPNTQRSELQRIRRALALWQPVRAELINYTKDGDEYWLELEVSPVVDDAGRCTHWVAVERDITERRQAEADLRLSEERFRLIARATQDVIWDWKLSLRAAWWSDGLEEAFGYDPVVMGHTPAGWTNAIHPDDRDAVEASINAAIEGTTSFWKAATG